MKFSMILTKYVPLFSTLKQPQQQTQQQQQQQQKKVSMTLRISGNDAVTTYDASAPSPLMAVHDR